MFLATGDPKGPPLEAQADGARQHFLAPPAGGAEFVSPDRESPGKFFSIVRRRHACHGRDTEIGERRGRLGIIQLVGVDEPISTASRAVVIDGDGVAVSAGPDFEIAFPFRSLRLTFGNPVRCYTRYGGWLPKLELDGRDLGEASSDPGKPT